MSIRPGVRRLFRLVVRRDELRAREVDEEIHLHLALRAEQLEREGLPPAAAWAEAERRFGAPERTRAALHAAARRTERGIHLRHGIDAVADDLRFAVRSLVRQPLLAVAVVLALGLGIGANATMFGVVDRLLLRAPAHVVDGDRLARLYFSRTSLDGIETTSDRASFPLYATIRDHARAFSHVAAMYTWRTPLRIGDESREANVSRVTASFFPLTGVRPALGRFFTADEDREPDGARVVVLGHGLWVREFGGDSSVLGRPLHLANEPYTIVGVAPAGFSGLQLEAVDAWTPLSSSGRQIAGTDWSTTRAMSWLQLVARLRPGVERAAADAELQMLHTRDMTSDPGLTPGDVARMQLASVVAPVQVDRGPRRSGEARIATWLIGVSAIVLLIACANVANLLLARAMRRRHEVAVRLALGVSRARLVGQLLTEGMLLALLGGVAGLLAAHWGGRLLQLTLLPNVAWTGILADGRVVLFAAVAALLTALLASLLPALQASRPETIGALKLGARGEGRRRTRVRTALLLVQATLSTVLLVGAGLFVASLARARATDVGVRADGLLLVEVSVSNTGARPEDVAALNLRLLERAGAMPEVHSAALAATLPLQSSWEVSVHASGADSLPVLPSGGPYYNQVTHRFFETTGATIVRGRGFTAGDTPAATRVAVISQTLAHMAWPGEDPIGRCVRLGSDTAPCREVVGVARDASVRELRPDPTYQIWVPIEQLTRPPSRVLSLLVRVDGDPSRHVAPLRRELSTIAPAGAHVSIREYAELVAPYIRPWKLGAAMFGIFGLLALVLAVIGLYSVMAYDVAQRTHELGVRIALGARTRDVVRLVVAQALRVAAAGVLLGTLAALAASRWVVDLLYDVSPTDARIYAGVALVLLGSVAAAALVPSWRATRVEPTTTLRGG